MKLSIISFTDQGRALSEKIGEMLKENREIRLYTKCRAGAGNAVLSSVEYVAAPLHEWAEKQMQEKNALLFIGACGIAVRAIAPSVTDKLQDAPVLVMDEKGRYVIPILAGHMGGANELAEYFALLTGAEPVITTATDLNEKFAVDLFAKRNHLVIGNKEGIVKVSSKVLAGKEITISLESGHGSSDRMPEGVRLLPYPPTEPVDVLISSQETGFEAAIHLKPKEYIIGIGCKKGKPIDEINGFIEKKLRELDISDTQIYALASISQKREEPGLIEWCRRKDVLFRTYTAAQLQEVRGEFRKSAFVKGQVGVDNVCERAALKACDFGGKLICGKCAENGMTIAVSKRKWMVEFI
ncbi:MAG: cobalamin biosynthesis protein [Lachnospiraceae bacterium]|nr:cobalamin biosynthesis protein [Lachnospiraceae bacterium]